MTFPNYKQLENLETVEKIEEEIFLLKKTLFDLKMKKSTNQNARPHLFVHTKRRIAQLKFKQQGLINSK